MVSKIISLVIVFVLMIAAPVYDAIAAGSNPAPDLVFGAGDGDGAEIEDVEDLLTLLTSVPGMSDYVATDEDGKDVDITDLYEDFRTFTMTEVGTIEQRTGNYTTFDDQAAYLRQSQVIDRVLSMCFTEEGVYYDVKGATTISQLFFEAVAYDECPNCGYDMYGGYECYNCGSSFSRSYDYDEILGGARLVVEYDINMYYSRDLIVVKYNAFDLKFGEYKSGDEYNAKWKNVEYEDVEDYKGLIPNEYLTLWKALPEDKTVEDWLEIYEGVLGKWMLVEVDEDFDEEEFMEEIEDADEDELVDLLTDYIVMINAVQFSSQASQQIGDVTAQNVTYLNKLAAFIATNYEENFEEDNGRYEMDDSEEVCQAYAAVFGIPHPMYYIYGGNARAYFTVETDNVRLYQRINASGNSEYGLENTYINMETYTTFSNIDNTVVEIDEKKVQSVADVFRAPLVKFYEDYIEELADELG